MPHGGGDGAANGPGRPLSMLRRARPLLPHHHESWDAEAHDLFDTGPEDRTFEQNVSRLDADLAPVEAIVLSHGHWDHAGAVLRALDLIRDRNGGDEIPYYAHPDMFRTRALKLPSGTMVPMQDVPGIDELTDHGARVANTAEPQIILDNSGYT
jgi:7,8-dihydropterin-6-yl-methyl-4-(beta-D-ribofuranosyl)aminobenzene 5'-phosphate synthase